MRRGEHTYHDYGEVPLVVHQRILGGHVHNSIWSIISPDLDVYCEQCDDANPDLANFYYMGPGAVFPPGVPAASLYLFAPIAPAVLAQLMIQAEAVALAERANLGLPALAVAGAAAVVAALPPLPAPGVPPGLAANIVWVALDDQPPYLRGDVVVAVGGVLPAGSNTAPFPAGGQPLYAWCPVPSGQVVMLKAVTDAEAAAMKKGDLRTLPIQFDVQGDRIRDFSSAVIIMTEDPLPGGNLPLEGPRTVLSVAKTIKSRGHSFRADFEQWKLNSHISAGDRSVYEGEVLTEALDAMFEVDQLNAPNLLCAEILARRWQLLKEAHRMNPGSPDYSAADHYMGWKHRRTGVDRALTKYVADQVKDEAAVLKELRKAREEHDLRNPRGRGKGRKGKGAHKGDAGTSAEDG